MTDKGGMMPRGLDLWVVLEVMIDGIKFRAKKKSNLGESNDLRLPVRTAEGSPHVILQDGPDVAPLKPAPQGPSLRVPSGAGTTRVCAPTAVCFTRWAAPIS